MAENILKRSKGLLSDKNWKVIKDKVQTTKKISIKSILKKYKVASIHSPLWFKSLKSDMIQIH